MRCNTRGLSTVVSVIILVAVAVSLAVAAYAITSGLITGNSTGTNITWQQSFIHVDASSGGGTVYISLVNNGPGSAQVQMLNITDREGNLYVLSFNPKVEDSLASGNDAANSITLSGSSGVAVTTGSWVWIGVGNGSLNTAVYYRLDIPSGGRVSITASFDGTVGHRLSDLFNVGERYYGTIRMVSGPNVKFTIQA